MKSYLEMFQSLQKSWALVVEGIHDFRPPSQETDPDDERKRYRPLFLLFVALLRGV